MPNKFIPSRVRSSVDRMSGHMSGILLMLGACLVMTIMDVIAKWLVEADYSVFQILALRGWMIVVILLIWQGSRGQLHALKTTRIKFYILRASIGFCAPFFFFTSLKTMPIADVVVIAFVAPLMMTALSVILLKETVRLHRWGAIIVGFIGVIIVIQPSGNSFQPAAIYVIIACAAYSLINIMTRKLISTEPPFRIVFYFNLGVAVIGSCVLPFVWKSMPLGDFGILVLMAFVAVSGHMMMTNAFAKAPVSVIAPFEYSALIWSTILGYLIWGDFPASHVWYGAGIIIASGLYMVHRERINKAERKENIIPG